MVSRNGRRERTCMFLGEGRSLRCSCRWHYYLLYSTKPTYPLHGLGYTCKELLVCIFPSLVSPYVPVDVTCICISLLFSLFFSRWMKYSLRSFCHQIISSFGLVFAANKRYFFSNILISLCKI